TTTTYMLAGIPSVIMILVGMIRLMLNGVANSMMCMVIGLMQRMRLFDYFLLPTQMNGIQVNFMQTVEREIALRVRNLMLSSSIMQKDGTGILLALPSQV